MRMRVRGYLPLLPDAHAFLDACRLSCPGRYSQEFSCRIRTALCVSLYLPLRPRGLSSTLSFSTVRTVQSYGLTLSVFPGTRRRAHTPPGRWSMRRGSAGGAARRVSRARPPSCSTRARTAGRQLPARCTPVAAAALHAHANLTPAPPALSCGQAEQMANQLQEVLAKNHVQHQHLRRAECHLRQELESAKLALASSAV
jgi:hypothetical protein